KTWYGGNFRELPQAKHFCFSTPAGGPPFSPLSGKTMENAPDKPLEGSRVLVAEDNPILAYHNSRSLIEAGAQVAGPAITVDRALELAVAEVIDCAVLDVYLRDGLVFPAAEVLKQKGAGIVFFTGRADTSRIKQEWPHAEVLA